MKFLKAIQHAKDNGSKLHIWGLLSNGGVHSSNEHIYGLLELAKQQGLDKVYVHDLLYGRDVHAVRHLLTIYINSFLILLNVYQTIFHRLQKFRSI